MKALPLLLALLLAGCASIYGIVPCGPHQHETLWPGFCAYDAGWKP